MHLVQVNLQTHFGGGEVYTAFLTRALSRLGIASRIIVNRRAAFWESLELPPDCQLIKVAPGETAASLLPEGPVWLLGHGPLPDGLRIVAPRRLRTAIAHMPVQDRNPAAFNDHDMIFAVSAWVRDGLKAAQLPVWPEPLYGVADLRRGDVGAEIRRRSRYDWDRRKFRDRLFSWCEPLIAPLLPHPIFRRRTGLTLGIVSRLTPIKQFPLLFSHLAHVLAKFPIVNLEIFGAGGYASVRDLEKALRPCRDQVRFWGAQSNMHAVYAQLDYLLTGLPEKEALGLNVIEAQRCNVPVLAPAAPPFTETIIDGVTGFLYPDPRQDHGSGFSGLLARLVAGQPQLQPAMAADHLARFSLDAFTARLQPIVAWAMTQ